MTQVYDATPLIPRAVLFGNPERAAPSISPDGRTIAYLAPQDGVLNIWVQPVAGGETRVVTADTKRGIRIFFWQEDSQHVFYLQDLDGDENWHVYQTNIESLTTRDLTPHPGVHAQVVGVSSGVPNELLVGLNLRNPQLIDVYRIDLATGESVLDTENPGDVAGWTADNQLRVRSAQAMREDGSTEIRLRPTVDAPWESFLNWGADESFGGLMGFTGDDNGVRVISSVDANSARLIEIDIATGASTVVAEDPLYDVSAVISHPLTHVIEAVGFRRAQLEWTVLDDALQADLEFLASSEPGEINIGSRDNADSVWIVTFVNDTNPAKNYIYYRNERRLEFLFTSQPAFDNYVLAPLEPISYAARDGMTLHGYLATPVGIPPVNLPLILLVHGGPWHRDTWGFNPSVQHLVNRGYAVLCINFRGSTGYGKDYLNAGDREWAGKMHDDLIDGKRWAISTGVADPNRVAIMGGSYGGYATLVGLTYTPDEFVCGVDIVGPSNLITLLESFPPYWKTLTAMMAKRVGDLNTDQEFLKSRSPLHLADRIVAPLLIGQGANDPRVKQAESDQIVEAMRRNGKPVEYLLFPDEGHGFARPENRFKFFAATEIFLAKYLGGRAEPASDAEAADELMH